MKVLACLPIILLISSIITILVFFVKALPKRRNVKAFVKKMFLGIFLSDIIILSSLIYYGNSYDSQGNNITEKENAGKPFILEHGTEYEITTKNKIFFSIFYGLINAPKMGTFGLKYPIIFDAAFKFPPVFIGKGLVGKLYGAFLVFLSFITPIFFGGFLVSYIKTLWNLILYNFMKYFKNVYYFSDLNEKSLLLAEDIVEKVRPKPLIVFCNWDKIPGLYADRIDQKHFIVIPDNEKDLIIKHNLINLIVTTFFGILDYFASQNENKKWKNFSHKQQQYFFEISEDDNLNLSSTNVLINTLLKTFEKKTQKKYFDNLKVYLFMDSSLFGSEQLFDSKQDKIEIVLVDEIKTSIYNLLFEKPLCERIDKNKQLSIAVFGNGAYAKEFFKDAIWASVLGDEYNTIISFIDKNADSFEKNLRLNCPGLFSDGKNDLLHFYPTNIQLEELNNLLNSEIKSPNYIIVDTGDDEKSINLAIFLRMFYIRKSIKDIKSVDDIKKYKPFIAVRIKNSKTSKRLESLKVNYEFNDTNKKLSQEKKLELEKSKIALISYEIYPFGSDEQVYSSAFIIDSTIEKLASNCYEAYKKITDDDQEETNLSKYAFGCNTSEFVKDSNLAVAVHIQNKLFRTGLKLEIKKEQTKINRKNKKQIELEEKKLKEQQKALLKQFDAKSHEIMDELKKIEHKRWKLFNFTKGWKCPDLKYISNYSQLLSDFNKPYKFTLAQFHGGLCSESDFIEFEKEAEKAEQYKKYKEIEVTFIQEIPYILGIRKGSYREINNLQFNKINNCLDTVNVNDNEDNIKNFSLPENLIVINDDKVTSKDIMGALEIDKKGFVDKEGNYINVEFDLRKCERWNKNSNYKIYTMLKNRDTEDIVGYINASPVTFECYNKIKNGFYSKDADIEDSDIKGMYLEGPYWLYLASMLIDKDSELIKCIEKPYQMLFNELIRKIIGWTKANFIVQGIVVLAITKEENDIYGTIMEKVAEYPNDMTIYELQLYPPKFTAVTDEQKQLYNILLEKYHKIGNFQKKKKH